MMVQQVRMSLWRKQHCINVENHVKFTCMPTFCLHLCECSALKIYPTASEISPLLCEPWSVLSQGSDPASWRKAYVILFNTHRWTKSRRALNGWILYEPYPLLLCLSSICIAGSHNARTDGNLFWWWLLHHKPVADFNACDAGLILGDINIYLHFLSFLKAMGQEVAIFLMEDNHQSTLHGPKHCCRWPGIAKCQGINSHGIDLVTHNIFQFQQQKCSYFYQHGLFEIKVLITYIILLCGI